MQLCCMFYWMKKKKQLEENLWLWTLLCWEGLGRLHAAQVKARQSGPLLQAAWIIRICWRKKLHGTSWSKREQRTIPKHFLNKSLHQMNSSDSQKTPSSFCILLGIGISTFITAVKLLYCQHESVPASSGSRRKGLFKFLFISWASGERGIQLQAKHTPLWEAG